MAEIASAYPTAGGLYYWASKLGSPAWGWFTGWFNLIGQIAVIAAIGYGLATFATVLLNFWFGYPNTKAVTSSYLYAIVLFAALCSTCSTSASRRLLNTVSAYWHIAGVAIIVIVLIIVPDNHQSFGYVFAETINNSGFAAARDFGSPCSGTCSRSGSLMAQYTITGYDASAHMAEETHKASRMAAVGMVMSVVVSVIVGWLLLLAVTFAIPSTRGRSRHFGDDRPVDLVGVDEPELGGDPALHLLSSRSSSASPPRSRRRRGCCSRSRATAPFPGTALAAGARQPGAAPAPCSASAFASLILMIPANWNYLVGYLVGTVDRRDRPLHRVHPARDPPLRKGASFERGRLEPRPPLQVDRLDRDPLGGASSRRVPAPPPSSSVPVAGRLHVGGGELRARHSSAAASCSSAAGTCSPPSHWFKGPVRMGTETELEQLEEETLGQFDLPTESPEPA